MQRCQVGGKWIIGGPLRMLFRVHGPYKWFGIRVCMIGDMPVTSREYSDV
jgi:hypothetical protein